MMLEVLQFVFSSFCVWAGTVVLLSVVAGIASITAEAIAKWALAIRQ